MGGVLMSIKDKLQIYLITYNRKIQLEHTLKQILAKDSPIRNFDITILDNASTDGASELIDEYCQNFWEVFQCLKFDNKIIFLFIIPTYFTYPYTTSKDTRLYLY